MNRAEEKRTFEGLRAFSDGIRAAGGHFKLELVRPRSIPYLLVEAMGGDQRAQRLCRSVDQTIRQTAIRNGACLLCGKAIGSQKRLSLVIIAMLDEGEGAPPIAPEVPPSISMVVCKRCDGGNVPAMQQKILSVLASIWPSVRVLDIHPQAGHA